MPATPACTLAEKSELLTCVGEVEGHAYGGVVPGSYSGVGGVEEHPIRPQQGLHLLLQALPHAHQLGIPTRVEFHQLLRQPQSCRPRAQTEIESKQEDCGLSRLESALPSHTQHPPAPSRDPQVPLPASTLAPRVDCPLHVAWLCRQYLPSFAKGKAFSLPITSGSFSSHWH